MSEAENLPGGVTLHCGDCLATLKLLEANSVDSVVTDPPYELKFMGKGWDSTGVAFRKELWREVLRVLKPGAHLLAFGGTRTYHRMACAIEDAGFEIRDQIGWLYGSGFPKSHDVSKGIDKRPGVTRHAEFAADLKAAMAAKGYTNTFDVSLAVVGRRTGAVANWQKYQFPEAKWWPRLRDLLDMNESKWGPIIAEAERVKIGTKAGNLLAVAPGQNNDRSAIGLDLTASATDAAREWDGWGTALKPAWEPIVFARKPLSESTVAANVLRWGVGAINIDGCRINVQSESERCGAESQRNSQCPIHGMPSLRPANAPLEVAGEASEVADDVRSKMSVREDAGCGESKLDRRFVAGFEGGVSAAECSDVTRRRPQTSADTDSARLSRTQNDYGQTFGTGTEASRKHTSHQWGEDGQQIREFDVNKLEEPRSRTREDREDHDKINGRERASAFCTCSQKVKSRWPANIITDGSEEVVAAFPDARSAGNYPSDSKASGVVTNFGMDQQGPLYSDSGSAARFFYTAKADSDDRLGSKHPTVKPVDLMQYLVRLVTPPRGTVLDLFAGTGTTGEAAFREGFRAILIEREAEYQDDTRRRMKLALAGPDERSREAIKAKLKDKPLDHGPLFGGNAETMRGGVSTRTDGARANRG